MADMKSLPLIWREIYNYIHIKTKGTERSALLAVSRLDILVEFLSNKVSVSWRCFSIACWGYLGCLLSRVWNNVAVCVSGELGILSIGALCRKLTSLLTLNLRNTHPMRLFLVVVAVGHVAAFHFTVGGDFDV